MFAKDKLAGQVDEKIVDGLARELAQAGLQLDGGDESLLKHGALQRAADGALARKSEAQVFLGE